MKSSVYRIAAVSIIALIFAVSSASAAEIFYDSFEPPNHADISGTPNADSAGWVRGNLPGYSANFHAGVADVDSGHFVTSYGSQAAWVYDNEGTSGRTYKYTSPSNVLEHGVTYTLTYNLASEGGSASVMCQVDLMAGSNVLDYAFDYPSTADIAAYSNSIIVVAPPNSPYLGESLAIRLQKPKGQWSVHPFYDNIRLTAEYVPDTDPPTAPVWSQEPVAAEANSIYMTASNAVDPSGVQYFFTNTVNGNTSGWQDEFFWSDSNLTAGVTYSYRFKARDNSTNLNETALSSEKNVECEPDIILYESFELPDAGDSGKAWITYPGYTPDGWFGSSASLEVSGVLIGDGVGVVTTPYGRQVGNASYQGGPTGKRIETANMGEYLTADYTYTLTFAAGNFRNQSGIQFTSEFIAGSNVVTNLIADTGSDDMSENFELVFVAGASHPDLGEELKIRFYASDGTWQPRGAWDNITLKALAPPPAGTVFTIR